MVSNTPGGRIEDARKKAGLTQQEVATKLHVKRETVNQWESNTRQIKSTALMELADLLNVSVDYLLCRTNAATQDVELQAICDYTGLDDKTIEILHKNKTLDFIPEILSLFLKEPNYKLLSQDASFIASHFDKVERGEINYDDANCIVEEGKVTLPPVYAVSYFADRFRGHLQYAVDGAMREFIALIRSRHHEYKNDTEKSWAAFDYIGDTFNQIIETYPPLP